MSAYESAKAMLLRVLRVPPEPTDPMGAASSLLVFRASPRYYSYKLLGWALQHAFALAGLGIGYVVVMKATSGAPPAVRSVVRALEILAILAVPPSIVLSWFLLRLDYELRWYKVTDRSLRIREGVMDVRETTMTFANVQNLTLDQGPIQRLFGIADLRIQSAGGGMQEPRREGAVRELHVAVFRGVDNAGVIRDMVAERLRLFRDAGLGDHDDAAQVDDAAAPASGGDGRVRDALEEIRREAAALRVAARAFAAR